jgi:hypothetical protein
VNLSDFPLQEGSRVVGLRELYATDPELPRAVGIDARRSCFSVTLSVLPELLGSVCIDVGGFITVSVPLSVLIPPLGAVGSDVSWSGLSVRLAVLEPPLGTVGIDDGRKVVVSVEFSVLTPRLGATGPDGGGLVVVTVEFSVLIPQLGAVGSDDGGFIVEAVISAQVVLSFLHGGILTHIA